MKKSTIIILVVLALLVIWGVTGYNGLVTMDENPSLPVPVKSTKQAFCRS